MGEELLEIKNLSTSFRIADDYYAAVDDVTLSVRKNEILAIVGESGSGKVRSPFQLWGCTPEPKLTDKSNTRTRTSLPCLLLH